MPRRRTEVEAGLKRKGFVQEEGDHHFFIYHTMDGLRTPVITKTSHGDRDIGDPLLAKMARQCRLTRAMFLDLIDCPLSRADYEDLLRQNGDI